VNESTCIQLEWQAHVNGIFNCSMTSAEPEEWFVNRASGLKQHYLVWFGGGCPLIIKGIVFAWSLFKMPR